MTSSSLFSGPWRKPGAYRGLQRLAIALGGALLIFSSVSFAQDSEQSDEPVNPRYVPTPAQLEAEAAYSEGMYLPFDGKNTKAFESSLEKIQEEVTDAEFTTLTNAIDYLLVYDLGARRDPEVLYKRLDGKTPFDVLRMVKWKAGRP